MFHVLFRKTVHIIIFRYMIMASFLQTAGKQDNSISKWQNRPHMYIQFCMPLHMPQMVYSFSVVPVKIEQE